MSTPSPFSDAVDRVKAGADVATEAERIDSLLTDDERLGLLDGDQPFWEGMESLRDEGYNIRPYVHGAVERLGLPGIRFVDGPRGCVAGQGTAFPVAMARGATWDPELERRVGEVIGHEVAQAGGNFFGGVCVNLPRHPAWGRIQETYGDEPLHLGTMGAALVRGVAPHAMTCGKHFALNSMENARFTVDVRIDERDLHDVYLPHFRQLAYAGVDAFMTAYNSVNGEWAGQNSYLLDDVLRQQWGWSGITVSDFIWGFRDPVLSVQAGLDLEEPFAQQRAQSLRGAIAAGQLDVALVHRAARRLIEAQLRFYARRSLHTLRITHGPELAREVAARSMVLLKNTDVGGIPVLPLSRNSIRRVAVIGRLADAPTMGDHGSSDVRAPYCVTALDGIRRAFPGAEVAVMDADDPAAAAAAARLADVAIVVVGFTADDEGEYVGDETMTRPELTALYPPAPPEIDSGDHTNPVMAAAIGGDRADLRLRRIDEEIIAAVAGVNPRTVVSVVAAGAVVMRSWIDQVPAVLLQWYSGMEGGNALADVLTGRAEPTGRLPFAMPASEADMPHFDRNARSIPYGRLHGQRLIDAIGGTPEFPHGWGLGYADIVLSGARIDDGNGGATVRATLRNRGETPGRQVVQVYGRRLEEQDWWLVGFVSAEAQAGRDRDVEVKVDWRPLSRWDDSERRRILPTGTPAEVEIGLHARDPHAFVIGVRVPETACS